VNQDSVFPLTAPLKDLEARWPVIHPGGLEGRGAVEVLGTLADRGIPDSPAMRMDVYDPVREADDGGRCALGEAIGHQVVVDANTGLVEAVPLRNHLTEVLFVNSSVAPFTQLLWRWAAVAAVLDQLSHDIASIDVSEDFMRFALALDPAPDGRHSFWRAWAEIP
jgi:hypothetical protein